MDFLDFLSGFSIGLPGPDSRRHTLAENITGAVGLMAFPTIDFLVALFWDLYKHPFGGMVVLPAAFTLASYLLCRRLQTKTGWTVAVSLGCALLCLVASSAAYLMGVFFSFFSAF
jgi:hypothetical protein